MRGLHCECARWQTGEKQRLLFLKPGDGFYVKTRLSLPSEWNRKKNQLISPDWSGVRYKSSQQWELINQKPPHASANKTVSRRRLQPARTFWETRLMARGVYLVSRGGAAALVSESWGQAEVGILSFGLWMKSFSVSFPSRWISGWQLKHPGGEVTISLMHSFEWTGTFICIYLLFRLPLTAV